MTSLAERLAPVIANLFTPGPVAHVASLPESGLALLALTLIRETGHALICVTDGPQTLETLHRDLLTLAGNNLAEALYFPAWEGIPGQSIAEDKEIAGARLTTLYRLLGDSRSGEDHPLLMATCIQALMQSLPDPSTLQTQRLELHSTMGIERDELSGRIEALGYRFDREVLDRGQASVRGGIVDVWPVTDLWPLRIESMGGSIESLRRFDPTSQRSVERVDRATVTPAGEWRFLNPAHASHSLMDYCVGPLIVLWADAETIDEHACVSEEMIRESMASMTSMFLADLRLSLESRPLTRQVFIHSRLSDAPAPALFDAQSIEVAGSGHHGPLHPDLMEQSRAQLLADLVERVRQGWSVFLFFDTPGSKDRFEEFVGLNRLQGMTRRVGRLSGGFHSETLRCSLVSEGDLYGRRRSHVRRYDPAAARSRPERIGAERLLELSDIEPGDLVVHAEHGIGRYHGVNEITVSDGKQEVLTVEYADGAKLHIPVTQIQLLTRYRGLRGRPVELHRLGGKRWSNEKEAAERSILDLASSLLETQAHRTVNAGLAFSADTRWQHEFEASFPYEETPDQERVIAEVKRDMESPHPMDRLLCGDAGYGKTEIAMRAAFKAAMDQRQTAVLVPTTILAQQHQETFAERMAPYPVRVEMLSRFCTQRQRMDIVRGLNEGRVDIVIGTHMLLHPDILFKNLGLVIIDEEQRFGVQHKERLKQLRKQVDVLTMTATPIPRTLYFSLTGVRDMSRLQTPPRERLAVETIIARNTDKIVREAILRELSREGQVFYLHNRVMTLGRVHERLASIVPEARVAVAHGQMPPGELAEIMDQFVAGEYDLLLCTTIIESGMDIPRVNTILVDRADRFGLADLYQLRGRVGRSNHKAYAYLLLPEQGGLDPEAQERIRAIQKHSGLGAGFHIAMQDLEIRGSGNLLGAAQSGHIAAIGFGLYCQLLRRTVERLKGLAPGLVVETDLRLDFIVLDPMCADTGNAAAIPLDYMEDEGHRLNTYRNIAEADSSNAIAALRRDLGDRFGPPPPSVERLLKLAELRILASERGISRVEARAGKVMLTRQGEFLMPNKRFPRLAGHSVDEWLLQIARAIKGFHPIRS